ncbi:MMPL family transporter [Microbispora sp. H10830]|uniref:MMPL family transporter n=1 Tax=Microbispora sp. H10830 TaxID=2729109 RepID=UPI00160164C4|nr:MMPL family transporter [Microbispora sp. H10830]
METLRRLAGLPAGRIGKWAVIAAWLVMLVPLGALAGGIGRVQDNDETNWMPASAQSTRAVELARREFPAGRDSTLVLVYAREGGLSAADRETVLDDRDRLRALAGGSVTGPAPSADGEALTLTVPVPGRAMETGEAGEIVARAREIMRAGLPAGLAGAATGPAAFRADATDANGRIDGTLTLVTVGVVALLLFVTYRSPVLPLVPLACVAAGVVAAQAGAVLAGRAGAEVSGSGSILMIVLVFGLGTDYALLLISRYREELAEHADRHHAMALALRRTVPSVAASAATMALAALALLAADMNSTKGLGPLAAIAVVAALLAMTTLLPALLTALGRGVFWPAIPRRRAPGARSTRIWQRIGALVSRRPRRAWALAGLALAALACGTAFLRVGVLDGGDNFTRKPESAAGQEIIHAHFPGGTTAPALVYAPVRAAAPVAALATTAPGIASTGPAETSASGRWVRITAVLADAPASEPARRSVAGLRARLARAAPGALIGGQTAALVDRDAAMDRDLAVIAPLVIGIVTLVLGVLLRAVVAPLLLLGCALLSSGAAAGLSTLLFHALGFPRTDQTALTLGFLFLVALGVDYTIFLMARAREEVARRGHREGTMTALVATGGVITGAGVVLAATFLVLTITPVVLNIQLGLLVALGVLVDAFVVRTVLVPALALDIGPATWWPARPVPAPRPRSQPSGIGSPPW